MKIKLLAEAAGLSAIGNENGQIVLRFPEGNLPEQLPNLGAVVRIGKTALWIPYRALADWRAELLNVLSRLQPAPQSGMVEPGEGT
jgi:hypothetical protein